MKSVLEGKKWVDSDLVGGNGLESLDFTWGNVFFARGRTGGFSQKWEKIDLWNGLFRRGNGLGD